MRFFILPDLLYTEENNNDLSLFSILRAGKTAGEGKTKATYSDVGQRWPCVLRRAALDSVSRVKQVLGSIPPATATEIK